MGETEKEKKNNELPVERYDNVVIVRINYVQKPWNRHLIGKYRQVFYKTYRDNYLLYVTDPKADKIEGIGVYSHYCTVITGDPEILPTKDFG